MPFRRRRWVFANRYMFYQMPKDVVQVHAAKELYRRNWRYHKEMRHWYTFESNTYCHFDTREWEKRPLNDDTNGTLLSLSRCGRWICIVVVVLYGVVFTHSHWSVVLWLQCGTCINIS